MARVKTVWTVTGPVQDPETGETVTGEVMHGSVTGDRLDVVQANVKRRLVELAEANGAQPRDYAVDVRKEADNAIYYRYVYDIEEAARLAEEAKRAGDSQIGGG